MRQVQQPPLAVIKSGLRKGKSAARLALGPRGGRVRRERIARRQIPLADGRVIQVRPGFGRVALDETPVGVQGNTFAR